MSGFDTKSILATLLTNVPMYNILSFDLAEIFVHWKYNDMKKIPSRPKTSQQMYTIMSLFTAIIVINNYYI